MGAVGAEGTWEVPGGASGAPLCEAERPGGPSREMAVSRHNCVLKNS